MKVLHFYKSYFPDVIGGIEQVIYQIVSATNKNGDEAEILTLSKNGPSTIKINNHLVHRARLNFKIASTGISISSFGRFAELSKKADIIHYHYPWPFMDIVHFATRLQKPTVITYHADIIRQKYLLQLYRPLRNRFLNDVNVIVATSPNYLESSWVLNQYRNKTRVIPIGLDRSSYPEPSAKIMEYWQAKFGQRFFLFIGVIRYYKGLHILLDAIHGTDLPIVIVGSGPYEESIKQHAARLNLQNIYFLKPVSDEDKVALIKLCYAVVFPSHLRSEAFGVSLLEGAMFGKPLISSEIGTGTSYVNNDKETGLVVPANNPAALRQAMQYLWDNPQEAAAMGQRSSARYQKLFTIDLMAANYMKLYRELLSK